MGLWGAVSILRRLVDAADSKTYIFSATVLQLKPLDSCESALLQQSLITNGELPLTEIAALAMREGRRPRPIYTAHKWFARRLGTVFRSLLVSAVSYPEDNFWQRYYDTASLHGLSVLDPFVGGGTSVVEARRLGASTVAVDVDPIACAITHLELTIDALPDLRDTLANLQSTVGQTLQKFHTYVSTDGTQYKVLHHFWVQVVICFQCGIQFDAHPHFQIAYSDTIQWVICSHCGMIESCNINDIDFSCSICQHRTTIMNGPVSYGKATCPECGYCEPLINVGRRTQAPPRWRQFAVEVLAQPDGGRAIPMKGRLFFASNDDHQMRFSLALKAYHDICEADSTIFPDFTIASIERFDSRLTDYGYRQWIDLFNPRQLLHLALLRKAISSYDEPIRTGLAMAFSDHLTTNCMLTSYAAGWRRLTPLFSVRAFRHVPRPVELNPWVNKTGRGSFPNAVHKLMRASAYIRTPREPLISGGFKPVPTVHVDTAPDVRCGTARDLTFLGNGTIDLVLTDPPYFDNIAYSELSEFFLPWLRALDVVPRASTVEKVLRESLVGQRSDLSSLERYREGLSNAFKEIARVLKPAGLVIFSYRHILPAAWLALADAIASHPLSVIRVFPAPGEAGIGLHTHEGTGLWDAIFVLRQTTDFTLCEQKELCLAASDAITANLEADTWAVKLSQAPLAFTDVDRLTLHRATLVGAALSHRGVKAIKEENETVLLAEALSNAT